MLYRLRNFIHEYTRPKRPWTDFDFSMQPVGIAGTYDQCALLVYRTALKEDAEMIFLANIVKTDPEASLYALAGLKIINSPQLAVQTAVVSQIDAIGQFSSGGCMSSPMSTAVAAEHLLRDESLTISKAKAVTALAKM
ncbi:hypothetical protein [Neptuniibacter sp. QD37_11]|uniref:hypothetical protein n=1 Tax=Neptuniibacter sp. QD37_11 TaxID=3398209 RepID=UPI0039F4E0B7